MDLVLSPLPDLFRPACSEITDLFTERWTLLTDPNMKVLSNMEAKLVKATSSPETVPNTPVTLNMTSSMAMAKSNKEMALSIEVISEMVNTMVKDISSKLKMDLNMREISTMAFLKDMAD